MTSQDQFNELFAAAVDLYPGFEPTERQLGAYWGALRDLPTDAVKHGFATMAEYSPDVFPTAGQIRMVALPVAKQIERQSTQLQFEQWTPPENDAALQDFYRKCDDVLLKTLPEKIEDDCHWILEGILIALGRVYGHSRECILGYRTESGRRRISNIPGPIGMWKSRAADPRSIVEGLRKVPAIFAKYPTPMMMDDVIRGFPTHGYPPEWLRPKDPEAEQ